MVDMKDLYIDEWKFEPYKERPGHLLFEADHDLNILIWIEEDARDIIGGQWTLTSDEKTTGNGLVVSMFKDGSIRWVTQPGRKKDPQPIPPEVLRQHLDEGLAEKLFVKYNKFKPIPKHKGDNRKFHGRYMCIILAARMMELGAVLSEERRAYLRKLIPQIPSDYGRRNPVFDNGGFRDPSKVQFLTALDNYKNGKPRELGPSCWNCGKTKAELGHTPKGCDGCKISFYCGRRCQKAEWAKHKPYCSQAKFRGLPMGGDKDEDMEHSL